jgi:hypothetical protein
VPNGARRAPELRPVLGQAGLAAVLAVLVGVLWGQLAPTPAVREASGLLVSPTAPEFQAGQDVVFALLAAGAGLLHGAVLIVRGIFRPLSAVLALVAGGVGSVAAWQLGALFGPASVAVQRQPGSGTLHAPLTLHAPGVLGIWPATTAAVLFTGLLILGLVRPPTADD